MTDSLRKAAEMALDALDFEAREEPESIWKAERDALRQALAESEPWVKTYCGGKPNYCTPETAKRKSLSELLDSTPEYEVVAMRYDFDGYGYKYIDNGSGSNWQTRIKDAEPLYAAPFTAPPKKEWIGLTDKEKNELVDAFYGTDIRRLEAIEAKLKEKNGG